MVTWCVIWQMSDYLGNDNRCSGLEVRAGWLAGRVAGGERPHLAWISAGSHSTYWVAVSRYALELLVSLKC